METKRHSFLSRAAMTLLLTVLTTVTAWADEWPKYITDVILVGGESQSEANSLKNSHSDYTFINVNLNDGAGGDYIYLGYKTSNTANTNGGYITALYLTTKSAGDCSQTLTFGGVEYTRTPCYGSSHFVNDVKGDLNSNAGGEDIHLYYTKNNYSDKRVISDIKIISSTSKVVSTPSGFTKLGFNGGTSDCDLNDDAGGNYVYMYFKSDYKVNRPYPEPSMASNLVYTGSPLKLISSTYTNNNTGTLYYRVGTSGSYTSTVNDVTATNAGTYTVYYYSGSNSYGNSSESYAHSKTVTIGKAQNSGATVVCADALESDGPSPTVSGTNLSTGAITYSYSTSQNGTYSGTVPNTAGTYWVKATIAGDNNYIEYTTAAVSFKLKHDWGVHNTGNTANDAYVISTTEDLNLLASRVNAGNNYKNKFFKLGGNITYDGTENNFTPIGVYGAPFAGTFDGNGKTISGLNINLGSNKYVGLFGYADNNATIKNLKLTNSTISGNSNVGAILGCGSSSYPNHTNVENCEVASDVNVSGSASAVGGITGAVANVRGCVSAASVSGFSYIGGIVGNSNGITISQCLYTGTSISSGEIYKGAITGKLDETTTILIANYYTADLDCKAVTNSNDIDGARRAVAINTADGVTVTPTGDATVYNVSGITAYTSNSGLLYNGQLYAGNLETVNLDITYASPYEGFSLTGYTDGNGHTLTNVSGNTYKLQMTAATATITPDGQDLWGIASGADGSQAHPYVITTPAGLDLLASNVNGGKYYQYDYFVLGDNITYDADALTLDLDNDGNNDSNYMPVGKDASTFMGNFDGQGHTISGISINANEMYRIGVFGVNDGTVKNLTVSDCLFAGSETIGAIAGMNRGTVENCHVAAYVSVTGNNTVGGIVGNNDGTTHRGFVLGCTCAAALSAKEYAAYFGGIAGNNSGTLTDNLFIGTIDKMPDGSRRIGAITGYHNTNYGGTLTNNFHTCSGMGGVGNLDDATNTDQAGAQFAVSRSTQPDASIIGEEKKTYGGTDYTGITAYANGLAYNGNYYISLWGGSGTEADPYVIYNTEGLDKLATNVNGGNYYDGSYFVLGDNIVYTPDVLTLDLDNDGENDSNYMPVGKNGSSFYGNFDGQGHTISGIRVNTNNMGYIGVFGINDGTVKNLTVSGCLFAGSETIGAIAGLNRGTVENCHVATGVSITGNFGVGGVVGSNEGFVLGCTSAAALSAKEYARYFGGIAGRNTGTLTDNLFTGTIDKMPNSSWSIGAITGYNDTEYGTLTNNFHTCSGMGGVGNDNDATNTDQDGAQIAVARSTQPDASIIGEEKKTYGGTDYTGITAYEHGLYYNGQYYYRDPSIVYWAGSGTAEDPYIIVNTQGMDKLATDVNGGKYYINTYFVLGNDIAYDAGVLTLDLDGDGNNDSNYMPVGKDGSSFMGNFDGHGHTISGIRVNANGMYRIGVFGVNDGTVKNLTVSDCLFAGDGYVGAIAGFNRGTVENCHVAAYVSVIGNNEVGGVVGNNEGSVLGCTSAATLSAKEYARYFGGIAGSNTGTLTDNLFTGTIDEMPNSSSRIGAITGYHNTNYGGTLTNNFHTCSGMGGVGNDNDATNTDQAGAQLAISSTTKPAASIIGEEKKTYGGTDYTGITAYQHGLYYNGNYYYRHEDVFMIIDLTGDATASAPITLWSLIERTMYGVYVDYDNYTIDLNLDGEADLQLVPDMGNGVIRISKLTGAANLTTNSLFELIEDGSFPYNGLVIKIDNSYQTEKVRPIFGIYDSGKDGMDFYNSSNISGNDGKQFDVMLKDRTFKKDGKWQTIVLPFDVDLTDPNSPLYGITYRTVTAANIENGTTLNLTFAENSNGDENTLLAGKPYIIKWDKAADYQGNESQYDITDPIFPNVTIQYVGGDFWNDTYNFTVAFLGTYNGWTNLTSYFADVSKSGLNKPMDVVLLGGDNKLHYAASDASLGACRAIFLVDPAAVTTADPAAHLTNYVMNLGNGEKLTGTFGDVMPGDANGDGVVTISDAVAIVNYILGKAPAGFNEAAADMNGDGKVTITDAVRVVNMIAAQQ